MAGKKKKYDEIYFDNLHKKDSFKDLVKAFQEIIENNLLTPEQHTNRNKWPVLGMEIPNAVISQQKAAFEAVLSSFSKVCKKKGDVNPSINIIDHESSKKLACINEFERLFSDYNSNNDDQNDRRAFMAGLIFWRAYSAMTKHFFTNDRFSSLQNAVLITEDTSKKIHELLKELKANADNGDFDNIYSDQITNGFAAFDEIGKKIFEILKADPNIHKLLNPGEWPVVGEEIDDETIKTMMEWFNSSLDLIAKVCKRSGNVNPTKIIVFKNESTSKKLNPRTEFENAFNEYNRSDKTQEDRRKLMVSYVFYCAYIRSLNTELVESQVFPDGSVLIDEETSAKLASKLTSIQAIADNGDFDNLTAPKAVSGQDSNYTNIMTEMIQDLKADSHIVAFLNKDKWPMVGIAVEAENTREIIKKLEEALASVAHCFVDKRRINDMINPTVIVTPKDGEVFDIKKVLIKRLFSEFNKDPSRNKKNQLMATYIFLDAYTQALIRTFNRDITKI